MALWQAGLAEYDALQGIAWRRQSIDGAMMNAPLVREAVGPNPTHGRSQLLQPISQIAGAL